MIESTAGNGAQDENEASNDRDWNVSAHVRRFNGDVEKFLGKTLPVLKAAPVSCGRLDFRYENLAPVVTRLDDVTCFFDESRRQFNLNVLLSNE